MKMKKLNFLVLAVLCAALLLGGCSRLQNIKLPPLPTPSVVLEPSPTADVFAEPPQNALSVVGSQFESAPTPTSKPTPTPTPTPTPSPTPDPNIPHMYIENATYPENMEPGGVVQLLGEIYTDKGVIAQVCGRITDLDGNNVQQCMFYPYDSYFSLAGTVNAELVFGLLEPGHYLYIVTAIAENNSYTNGEETLIHHGFEVYYP